MDDILPNTLTESSETVSKMEESVILPGLVKTKNEIESKRDYEFIAKPLQLSDCNYSFSKSLESQNDSVEEKDIVCTYINSDGDGNMISPAEFGFGITEEIVESELCNDSILIDKMAYTNSVQTTDTLSFCSILDQIPQGNDLVDGNVNIELYLECTDDNENNNHEHVSRLKPNYMIAEATSQIKMDTQFKVSFPLIPERGLKCSLCKLLFLSKEFLREHTILKHFTDFLFCNLCSYFTKSKKFFNTHVQTRHSNNSQSSGLAGVLSPLRNKAENKVKITDNKTVKRIGDRVSNSISNANRNLIESEKHFAKKNSKNLKTTNKEQEQTVRCELCEFRTKSNRLLNYHKQTMHNKRREIFRCSDCKYRCLQRRSFESHQKRHTGVFEFDCKICEKKFVSKHLLTKHLRKHKEESVKKTNNINSVNEKITAEKILRSVSTQTKLVKALNPGTNTGYSNVRTNKRVSELDVDSQASSYVRMPKKKRFKCTFNGCNKDFRDSFNLETHLAVHTKSKSIKCAFCVFTCIQMSSLNHHIKTRHK